MARDCVNVEDMEQWVQAEDPAGLCRPCLLGPVTSWYIESLQENGHEELARQLGETATNENLTPVELARQLDGAKKAVAPEVRERLLDFDCSAQSYQPE